MRTIQAMVRSSGRLLARRLQQLQSKLQVLIQEVRSAVARLVSETLGTAVQDAVEQAIDQVTEYLPQPACHPRGKSSPTWDDPAGPERSYREATDPWFHEAAEQPLSAREVVPEFSAPVPGRLSIALTAGVHAATWWRRRWPGLAGVVMTVPVGLVAAGVAYVAPALALLGLRLAGCAVQLQDLMDVLHPLGMI
jgi:hypothetical protein